MCVLERQLSTAQVMMAECIHTTSQTLSAIVFTFERFACALIHRGYILDDLQYKQRLAVYTKHQTVCCCCIHKADSITTYLIGLAATGWVEPNRVASFSLLRCCCHLLAPAKLMVFGGSVDSCYGPGSIYYRYNVYKAIAVQFQHAGMKTIRLPVNSCHRLPPPPRPSHRVCTSAHDP